MVVKRKTLKDYIESLNSTRGTEYETNQISWPVDSELKEYLDRNYESRDFSQHTASISTSPSAAPTAYATGLTATNYYFKLPLLPAQLLLPKLQLLPTQEVSPGNQEAY